MKNIVYFAKTNLNTDGRILNQLKILHNNLDNVRIDFILFPDKPLTISMGNNVRMHIIKTGIRHKKLLRAFTVIDFTIRSFLLLLRLNPDIIHAHDTAVCLPVLLFRIVKGKNTKVIYDDHEITNENADFTSRLYEYFEIMLMKKSDYVIFANEERMSILKNKYKLNNCCLYFLNLPYYDEYVEQWDDYTRHKKTELDELIAIGYKFIIHQGALEIERGRKELAEFSKMLPENVKILLLGGNEKDFKKFIAEYDLNEMKFYFCGSVNYTVLNKFWEYGFASIVMYQPNYINNRLCAPNRLYISIKQGLPVIVNKDNPVLNRFITTNQCGFFIEDFNTESDIINVINNPEQKISFNYQNIRNNQISNFVKTYKKIS
jgi:hypothetical protein